MHVFPAGDVSRDVRHHPEVLRVRREFINWTRGLKRGSVGVVRWFNKLTDSSTGAF